MWQSSSAATWYPLIISDKLYFVVLNYILHYYSAMTGYNLVMDTSSEPLITALASHNLGTMDQDSKILDSRKKMKSLQVFIYQKKFMKSSGSINILIWLILRKFVSTIHLKNRNINATHVRFPSILQVI